MTKSQLEHHTEQMEALRQEFERFWHLELEPRHQNFNGQKFEQNWNMCRDIAWHAFRKAKGL
jgi:hypothetical protein